MDPAQLEVERQRLTEALALAERDLNLVGYEFHDGVIQDLTAALLLLEGSGQQAAFASPEVKENYAGGLRLLRDCVAEGRRLIRGLASMELDSRGLCSALSRLVEKFRTDHGMQVEFACDSPALDLPASIQHLLFRIAQESLHNVSKHARASEVAVRLEQRYGTLELSIADNGVGFEPAHVPAGHFGLEGIRERARVLGADLLIDTAPHHGTRIIVRLTLATAL